jgi:tetratricopeptide (TPR) repeat protein
MPLKRGSTLARCAVLALAAAAVAASSLAATRSAGLPGKWVEVRSPHFVVVGDGGRRSVREVATHFEQVRALFVEALPGSAPPDGPPLRVFAASGERTLKRLLPEHWEDRSRARPAGAFRHTPTGSHVALRADLLGDENYSIVYHEYFHFLVRGTRWKLPVWLEEGLASFWGNTRMTPKVAEVGRPDAQALAYLRGVRFLPLAELMAVERSSPHYQRSDKTRLFYAQSWALVHYLNLGDRSGRRREQLADYLRRSAAGKPRAQAALAFGDLAELESELRGYTRDLLFPYAKLAPPAPLGEDGFAVRDLPPAELAASAALFRLESGRTEGVEEWVALALAGAPDLVETQVAAGVFHAFEGEDAEAEQAFARATRLPGATPLAHYGLAVLTFHRDATPESLETVERHLSQALVLEPRFAPAKARLSEVYRRTDGCSDRALIHIRGAALLHPAYPIYRLKEAQLLLECGRAEEARTVARSAVEEAVDSESVSQNNGVCWHGSLWGLAAEVLPACDRAVELSPEAYSILDSRGVARAIIGDLAGAAADLGAALRHAGDRWDEETRARRSGWLRRLESGENPFAGDWLAELRDDPEEAGLGWLR